jgi:hypothetical protein
MNKLAYASDNKDSLLHSFGPYHQGPDQPGTYTIEVSIISEKTRPFVLGEQCKHQEIVFEPIKMQ